MKKMGIDVTFVDQNLPEEELAKAFRPNTRAMFGETITNPVSYTHLKCKPAEYTDKNKFLGI